MNINECKKNFEIIKNLKISDIEFKNNKILIKKSNTIAKLELKKRKFIYVYSQKSNFEYIKKSSIDFENEEKAKLYLFNLLKWKYKNRKKVKNNKVVFPYQNVE